LTDGPLESPVDDDLAHEGDAGLSADSNDADEELEDELIRRRLPISTRTKNAFDRFTRRYSAALADQAFLDELGPVVATSNAVIFDNLLARLLERGIVDPQRAIDAQLAVWRLLWGDADHQGIATDLDPESHEAVDDLLDGTMERATTLRGLATSLGLKLIDASRAELRDTTRHLFIDERFDLDPFSAPVCLWSLDHQGLGAVSDMS